MNIINYLTNSGYSTIDDSFYNYIDNWFQWYRGKVENFHKHTIGSGLQTVEKERYGLGMAKKVAEDWANLLLNENVVITSTDFDLTGIFEKNNFTTKANQLIELSYALGTGAFVEYGTNDGVVIDYIRADMIYPLVWKDGVITECAFGRYKKIGSRQYVYLQIHVIENGVYIIKNRFIDPESGLEADAGDMEPEIITGYEKPLFQIITPNVVNNVDLDCPMGISVYANAVDQLKGLDLVYDSYCNEFELGKKRIIIPPYMTNVGISQDGVAQPVFDSCNTTFYGLDTGLGEHQKLEEINMAIRSVEHDKGLQRQLNLLSAKCGLGDERYSFGGGGVKAVAETVSQKSDLFRNLKKHQVPLKSALTHMVEAIAFLSGVENAVVNIEFDDSIIKDRNEIVDRNIKLIGSGLRAKVTAIMEINRCDEQTALQELQKIQDESA